MRMYRAWAMPSPRTFDIGPIADLLRRWLAGRKSVVDPFARGNQWAHHANDLDPAYCSHPQDAEAFCDSLALAGVTADAVLFDPPYSPNQISETYRSVGLTVGMTETQSGAMYRRVRDSMDRLLAPGGIAISCGWNSAGFGVSRGYQIREILLVAHGGAHNDTIVTVEEKHGVAATADLFSACHEAAYSSPP